MVTPLPSTGNPTAQPGLAWRVALAFRRKGRPIIVRQVTLAGTPTAPNPNPPTLDVPVLAAPVTIGQTTLGLDAAEAVGRLVVGDQITVAGHTYTVTAETLARPFSAIIPGFDAVAITPAIAAAASTGTAVTMGWAAEMTVFAKVANYSRALMTGDLVQMMDLAVRVPAYAMAEPQLDWRLQIDGRDCAVVSKQPVYAGTTLVTWTLQAR